MPVSIRIAAALLGICSLLVLKACSTWSGTINPDFNPARPHHRPDGFANRYLQDSTKAGVWRWQIERWRDGLPRPPAAPITGIAPDTARLKEPNATAQVTWVGHSTLLVQIDGVNILTDPHWGERASPVPFAGPRRHQPPGVAWADLPPIHVVLISHNHYDHLDLETVRRIMREHPGVKFYVPLGLQWWFESNVPGTVVAPRNTRWTPEVRSSPGTASSALQDIRPGANVLAMDWDESITFAGRTAPFTLHFLAVQHWSARTPWDRQRTLWGSWAVLHPRFRFWFGGDFGQSPDTLDIGQKLGGFDLAAIPIGAYEPRWLMGNFHVNPAEALAAMRAVRARSALAIHWGTFESLTDESLDQPPRDLEAALRASPEPRPDFRVLRHGETWLSQAAPSPHSGQR